MTLDRRRVTLVQSRVADTFLVSYNYMGVMTWEVEVSNEFAESQGPATGDMMARKFRALVQEALSPEEQATAQAESRAMLLEMNLRQIREKLSDLSQEEVAQLLDVTQPYISKLERQQDMLVSKLYDYVATLGGEVEIRAKFPAYDVVVRQFDDLAQVM